jgi:hypothetical protein
MSEPVLVQIEARFLTAEDPHALGDRVREAAAMIVGRDALEDFRVKVIPLTPPKETREV